MEGGDEEDKGKRRKTWRSKPRSDVRVAHTDSAERVAPGDYNAEYIALLEERNRILKRAEQRKMAEKKEILQRERGFELYISGANEERIGVKTRTGPRRGSGRRVDGDSGMGDRKTWTRPSQHTLQKIRQDQPPSSMVDDGMSPGEKRREWTRGPLVLRTDMGTQEYPIKDEDSFMMGSGDSSVVDETGIEDVVDEDETLDEPADPTLLPRLDDSIEESDLVRESVNRPEEDIDDSGDQTLSPIAPTASKSPSSTVQLSPQEKKLIRDSLEEIGWLTQRDRVPSRSRTVIGFRGISHPIRPISAQLIRQGSGRGKKIAPIARGMSGLGQKDASTISKAVTEENERIALRPATAALSSRKKRRRRLFDIPSEFKHDQDSLKDELLPSDGGKSPPMHVDVPTVKTAMVSEEFALDEKMNVEPKSESSTHLSAGETGRTVRESSQVRIGEIMSRLQGLDREKQNYILQVLEQLEGTRDDETRLSILESVQWLPSHNAGQPEETWAMQPMAHISFHLISNWGHEKYIGITAIEFIDGDGQAMSVDADDVAVIGSVDETSDKNIGRLFDGKKKTTNDRRMWCTKIPSLCILEISFAFPQHAMPAGAYVWNYNKPNQLHRGVREMEVVVDGTVVWSGEVAKGSGNVVFDFSTKIEWDLPMVGPVDPSDYSFAQAYDEGDGQEGDDIDGESSPHALEEEDHSMQDEEGQKGQKGDEVGSENQETREESKVSEVIVESSIMEEKDGMEKKTRDNHADDGEGKSDGKDPKIQKTDESLKKEESIPSGGAKRIGMHALDQSGERDGVPDWLKDDVELDRPAEKPPTASILDPKVTETPRIARANLMNVTPIRMEAPDQHSFPAKRGGLSSLLGESYPEVVEDAQKSSTDSVESKGEIGSLRQMRLSSRRSARFPIEESMDSLSLFAVLHQGRLPMNTQEDDAAGKEEDEEDELAMKKPRKKWTDRPIPMIKGFDQFSVVGEDVPDGRIDVSHRFKDERDDADVGQDEEDSMMGVVDEQERSTIVEIPTLPRGKLLEFRIFSTWGDDFYVGLSGITVFDDEGNEVAYSNPNEQVSAIPSDINELEEYTADPRVVQNVVNGVNRTKDDFQMWLAPFVSTSPNLLFLRFDEEVSISMISIWNYNKSRVHAARGVRECEIYLDGNPIFAGDILRAPGDVEGFMPENILLTTDEKVLAKIASSMPEVFEDPQGKDDMDALKLEERPPTAGEMSPVKATAERPFTSASRPVLYQRNEVARQLEEETKTSSSSMIGECTQSPKMTKERAKNVSVHGKSIRIDILESWGDMFYIGLTGIEVLDATLNPVPISPDMMIAKPRDMNDLPGHVGDPRTLDKLVNGVNQTTDDENMWLVPRNLDCDYPIIKITVEDPETAISGLRIWNYNKSPEDVCRGVKVLRVFVDGQECSPPLGHMIRIAPGVAAFDYSQVILFQSSTSIQEVHPSSPFEERLKEFLQKTSVARHHSELVLMDFVSVLHPIVCSLHIRIVQSHGDMHYIGLNGLEVYDPLGRRIEILPSEIFALPFSSVNDIASGDEGIHDIRTLDKLIDGEHNGEDEHSWLVPWQPVEGVSVYIMFNEPVVLGMMKIWNYSKKPVRGVSEFEVIANDSLIYRGFLPPSSGIPIESFETVLFTNDHATLRKERPHIHSRGRVDQDVVLFNDGRLMGSIKPPADKCVAEPVRPSTAAISSR